MAALPAQVRACAGDAAAFADMLRRRRRGAESTTRAALARLPVTRKSELLERQQRSRATRGDPFGGFSAIGWRGCARRAAHGACSSRPGRSTNPRALRADYWRLARALFAAGFRAGDLVHNCFSYHLTPAGSMMESGAHAIGCTVFPGGVGNTELQLQAIAELKPDGYIGTPSFLKILVEKAAETRRRIASMRRRWSAAKRFRRRCATGCASAASRATSATRTADLGLIAYETAAREGLVLDEGVIVEIVRPGTGDPVPDGEVGEVVVTALTPDYPLIRFGTGDLSAVLPGRCPSGRTNSASRAGSAAPTRRPRCAACSSIPARWPTSCAATPRSAARAGRRGRDGERPHDLHAEVAAPRPRAWPNASPAACATSPSCAATWCFARPAACPTTAR